MDYCSLYSTEGGTGVPWPVQENYTGFNTVHVLEMCLLGVLQ